MIKPEKVEDIIINAPCGTIPPPPPPSIKWGIIKGNINNQKDLIKALDNKANVSSVQANTLSIQTLSTNLNDTNDYVETLENRVAEKQNILVSGTNIKTINNESILGSGNIEIQGGGENYSTTEQRIGTWIDGKPLYRRAIQGVLPTAKTKGTIVSSYFNIADNVDFAYLESGYWISGTQKRPLILATSNSPYHNLYVRGGIDNTQLIIDNTWPDVSNSPFCAIVQYTKTTDTVNS